MNHVLIKKNKKKMHAKHFKWKILFYLACGFACYEKFSSCFSTNFSSCELDYYLLIQKCCNVQLTDSKTIIAIHISKNKQNYVCV